jgi:hypothetical protein
MKYLWGRERIYMEGRRGERERERGRERGCVGGREGGRDLLISLGEGPPKLDHVGFQMSYYQPPPDKY